MKLIILFLFIQFIGYCQPKLFSSYNIFEKYNKESKAFESVNVGEKKIVWEIYFDKEKGEVVISDSSAKAFYGYKIISSEQDGIKTVMKVNKEGKSNENDVMLIFYKDDINYVFEEITPKYHLRRRRLITS